MIQTFGIQEFKQNFACQTIEILRSPKTNKIFASCSNGKTLKVEQAIDLTKPVVVLVEDGDLDLACIINKREAATSLGFIG